MELYPLLSLEVHVILEGDVQCISPCLLKDGILETQAQCQYLDLLLVRTCMSCSTQATTGQCIC